MFFDKLQHGSEGIVSALQSVKDTWSIIEIREVIRSLLLHDEKERPGSENTKGCCGHFLKGGSLGGIGRQGKRLELVRLHVVEGVLLGKNAEEFLCVGGHGLKLGAIEDNSVAIFFSFFDEVASVASFTRLHMTACFGGREKPLLATAENDINS